MARADNESGDSRTFTLVLLIAVVAMLYLAQEVLIPLALATLITFILAPFADRLERCHLGRIPAILISVGTALAVLAAVGWVVAGQLVNLAEELPRYQENIIQRIRDIKSSDSETLANLKKALERLSAEISSSPPGAEQLGAPAAPADTPKPAIKPVPVEVVNSSPFRFLGGFLSGAMGVLAQTGVVIVFVIFMLLSREDLRNRLIRLIGPDQISVTTQALDEAGRRVSRYLRAQLLVNAMYGVMVAVGLYFLGIPNAMLWGLIGALLRYVPYVGPWLGALAGILLSVAVHQDWVMPVLTVALYVTAELIVNNVLEPIAYQSSTGISTIGIIVAAVFWTWLWGAVGLVLSTPLTVCIAVLGRYVPQLEFLNVMLTDESVLPPPAHLYQRLLAGDDDEARELVEEYVKKHSVESLFDDVLLPTLVLTERDDQRGTIEAGRREHVLDNLRELLDELPEFVPEVGETPRPGASDHIVMIVPARDVADELAGRMLQLRLRSIGIDAEVLSSQILFGEIAQKLEQSPGAPVIVSAVPPSAVRHARAMCKRLQARHDAAGLLAGLWGESVSNRVEERLLAGGAAKVVTRLSQAVEFLERHRAELVHAPAGNGDA